MLPSNPDRMNNLDFFFSPSSIVATSTGHNGDDDDDDWGEFVDSPLPPNHNGSDSTPKRIESEEKSHGQWVTSRGPLPLSVFGEEEEAGDESGSTLSSFNFSFDSFSGKHKNDSSGSVNRIVNSNPTEGISGLIANLYRENGFELKNEFNSPEINNNESFSNRKIENSGVSLENLSWNPLNLDTEKSQKTSNVVNSSTCGVTLDPNSSDLRFSDKNEDDDDGWEFKTAQSMFRTSDTADRSYKEEQEKAKSGSVWSLPTNGVAPNFDTGNAVQSVFHRENGDADLWDNGGWEFKVAESGEPKNDLTNKESNGWGFGLDFEPISKIETTSFQSNLEKEPQKRENSSNSFPSYANVNSKETSWAFEQPSLETGDGKEEKELQKDKPKGVLPLSFFEDEKSGTSDILVHEDNLDSFCDFPVRKKTKALSPTVSINDLISSLYSQVEEKNVVNLSEESEKYEVVSVKAASDSNLVYGEDDSWEFQGPKTTIADLRVADVPDDFDDTWEFQGPKATIADSRVADISDDFDSTWEFQSPKTTIADSRVADVSDDFDSTWEFQGPSLPLESSDVTESVNELDDDSWGFQGSTQPVIDSMSRKGDNGTWEYKHSSVENEFGNDYSVSNGFGGSHEKQVVKIEPNDYQDFFNKLKTELYCIALNHLETLKGARDLSAEADDDRIWDGGIEELQKCLNNDVLRSEVNLESPQPRSSGITDLYKALQEPNFRALDSEDLLSERLLLVKFRTFLAEKDWKSTIELLKHATVTLKIINLGSPEQQSKYTSTWFAIASACAQELRHATSIWKQVIENGVQEEILSKPQGKSYILCVWEIYRVAKILRASIRLYKPWILLTPTSSNVLAVVDECVSLWLSSGLEEALWNNFNSRGLDSDYSANQLLGSIKYLDEVDAFTLHTSITSATTPTCYISGLNTEMVPGMKTVEWKGEHYLLPVANLWANMISREPPSIPGHHHFPTVSS